jgi:polyhydroxyalkanoate synthesis regulator phasin
MGLGAIVGAIAAPVLGQAAQNIFGQKEARKNRQFQAGMRATQYQTAVQDLRAANLNPMLAYSQGGAGTPSGSQATTSGNPGEAAISNALMAKRLKADVDKIQSDINVNEQTISTAKAVAQRENTQALLNRATTAGVLSDNELRKFKGDLMKGINESRKGFEKRQKKHIKEQTEMIQKRVKKDPKYLKHRQNYTGYR